MLEMLLDKKLLFVLMGMLTGLGVADKCIVSMTMKRMIEAAGSMSKSNHPLMRLVRAKFEHACMISDTVENVGVFVDKYLYEYKVCGLRLHSLRRLEKMCSGLLIVTGLAGAGITCQVYGMGDEALRMGAAGCGLGILVWLFHLTTDENYCMEMAKNYMVDYLENVCLRKYEKMNQKELAKVARIDVSGMNPLLKECHIQVACDVNNPLCGENGSTYVYGPQKGVTEDMKKTLDEAMAHFARVTSETLENDYMNTPGAGAAGGLGYAFLAYTGAALTPGIELILDAVGLEEELSGADVVVTGEGRLDFQTAMGKAPVGVARLAKKYNAKVIAFAGSVTKEATACNKEGIDAFFPILRGVCTLAEAMDPVAARNNMTATVEQVFRLL